MAIRHDRRNDLSPMSHPAAALVAFLLVSFGLIGSAVAESGSVRYSYEQVEIGERNQWVLVPEPAEKLGGKITKEKIRQAFNALRSDKGTSYGSSSVEITGSVPDSARVTVHIDPNKAKYKLIIMAETVYTLTEMGVESVEFPGYAEGGLSRKDVPFSAYTVSMPLWRALPPGPLVDARIRMPDGELLTNEQLEERWNREDEQLMAALYSYLESDQNYTVISVARRLPKLEVPFAEQVLPLLKHEARSVRTAGLEVLANARNKKIVLEGVVELMQSEEKGKLATKAAEFLGKAASDQYNVFKHFYYLEQGETNQRVEAAKKMADKPGDDRVVERLDAALRVGEKEQKKVAQTAATSLLKLDAYAELQKALGDKGVPASVRMQIAEGLTDEPDDESKVAGYSYIGENAEGRTARVAIRSLKDVGTDGAREAVESFLTDDDRRVRLTAAETVQAIGSIDSLPALAEAVRGGKNADEIEAAGVEMLGSKALSVVLEKTGSSDKVVRRMAYRALGPKAAAGEGGSEVFETLKEGADSSDPTIRGAAVRGMGAYANEKALGVLKTLADDSAPAVRRDVAYALGNYTNGEMKEKLLSYLDDSAPEVIAAALDSLAQRGGEITPDKNESLWAKIKGLTESEQAIVREHAYIAMAQLVDKGEDQAARSVISMLSGALTSGEEAAVVRTAIEQLGVFQRKRAVNGIAIQLQAKEKEMRLTAIRALAKTGHSSAADLLYDTLGDPDAEIRRAAVEALGAIGSAAAIPKLQQRMKEEKNEELKQLMKQTINKL